MSLLRNFVVLLVLSCAQGWFWPESEEEKDQRVCLAKPQSDDKLKVEFALYTRGHIDSPENLTPNQDVIKHSRFSSSKNTKFITHGYTDKGSSDWIFEMLQTILAHEDVNIIVVNWQKGADSLNYAQSAANTLRVGEIVGDFIKALHETTGIEYASVHLIGHSLGSHVCGFAGARLNGLVGRVTGLDPAGPCFRFAKVSARLNEDQAVFVDAIHTNAGGFGTDVRMGHADYYPNGGRSQPGCNKWFWQHLAELFRNWFSGFVNSVACSHMRVIDLFTESVASASKFTAYPCDKASNYKTCMGCGVLGCSKMGYYAPSSSRGIYTLRT